MSAASALSQDVGKKAACEALAVPRATFYRHMSPESHLRRKSLDLWAADKNGLPSFTAEIAEAAGLET